jgi:hypothetical protein
MPDVPVKNIILQVYAGISGQSRSFGIDRLIYVVPAVYTNSSESRRYAVARLIGKLTRGVRAAHPDSKIVCIGPGRWGSAMPSLGVPVSFSEINASSCICEIDSMHEGLTPDLSLGTHFFNEMVEMNMLYIGHFARGKNNIFNDETLMSAPNQLDELLPGEAHFGDIVKVVGGTGAQSALRLYLNANCSEQRGTIYYLD